MRILLIILMGLSFQVQSQQILLKGRVTADSTGESLPGVSVLIVPVGPPVDHKFSIDQVVAELKEAGYSSFEVNVNLLPYQFIIKAK